MRKTGIFSFKLNLILIASSFSLITNFRIFVTRTKNDTHEFRNEHWNYCCRSYQNTL